MTSILAPEPRKACSRSSYRKAAPRHTAPRISGRFRPIPARLLASAWWLYRDGHISKLDLRVYFAAHEMAERRRYTRDKAVERPWFKMQELQKLVGGTGSNRSERDLASAIRRLDAVGLARISAHRIVLPKSIDPEAVGEGSGESFRAFLGTVPNISRNVPVPRRMVRALAAGFSRAQTAYILAALLCSLFWRKREGHYTTDGRLKGSWVAQAFGVSRSAVTEARKRLIALGWLRPLAVEQWAANRYGVHDVINVEWALPKDDAPQPSGERPSGSPAADPAGPSGSPIRNKSTLPSEDSNTRRPGEAPPGPPPGECNTTKETEPEAPPAPNLRQINPIDLSSTERLIELHRQAVARGLGTPGEGGLIEFLAMAHRAQTRGHNPGGLLFWLLSKRKTEFVTIADEDAARRRLREQFHGPDAASRTGPADPHQRNLSEDEQTVENAIKAARKCRIADPFEVVLRCKGWTRERWLQAEASYRRTQARHWEAAAIPTGALA